MIFKYNMKKCIAVLVLVVNCSCLLNSIQSKLSTAFSLMPFLSGVLPESTWNEHGERSHPNFSPTAGVLVGKWTRHNGL
jgi:hypothetical protein